MTLVTLCLLSCWYSWSRVGWGKESVNTDSNTDSSSSPQSTTETWDPQSSATESAEAKPPCSSHFPYPFPPFPPGNHITQPYSQIQLHTHTHTISPKSHTVFSHDWALRHQHYGRQWYWLYRPVKTVTLWFCNCLHPAVVYTHNDCKGRKINTF